MFKENIWKFFKLFQTALMLAIEDGNLEIAKLLIEKEGIDINAKNNIHVFYLGFHNNIWKLFKIYWTALFYASRDGYKEIVKILLRQEEIDVNVKDIFSFCLILDMPI